MIDSSVKTVTASAPSNIALIKYMGKTDSRGADAFQKNEASNGSLSWTLGHLQTHVTLVERLPSDGQGDHWVPQQGIEFAPVELAEAGQRRFLEHLNFLKVHFGVNTSFQVRSGNNFPADCGLASSASSFAALTMAFRKWLLSTHVEMSPMETCSALSRQRAAALSDADWAHLSRRGSGSSCRSFFGPWTLWDGPRVESVELPWNNLAHAVVLVTAQKKKVSSSEAHRRVPTSALFVGRSERAAHRLQRILNFSSAGSNWRELCDIAWQEFWDMHALFETSQPSFGYLEPDSLRVLGEVRRVWEKRGDGPLATMDAGANVHLLWRPDQTKTIDMLVSRLRPLRILSSEKSLNSEGHRAQ